METKKDMILQLLLPNQLKIVFGFDDLYEYYKNKFKSYNFDEKGEGGQRYG